ncbi:DUF1178 family protein [Alterisphingorhabdus coralli]|uniref:DUF1178 family protein n=1 Tax=Alterisphingorhabdus coralli TaxID=3071408 RepID=A0AA97I0K4_9SPHN|nr:DUF1178 family protein [Parasphingorhabdus sp. SCSIO 66989]WOE74295.1 DUF1178 family protein [Parasphingorhabdus sp. SCSIO 66989]
MIVFDLQCKHGHVFEGWFGSSEDYDGQQERGLLVCPICGNSEVSKAVMAPNVGRKGNQLAAATPAEDEASQPAAPAVPATAKPASPGSVPAETEAPKAPVVANGEGPAPAEIKQLLTSLAKAQSKALEQSTWVGRDFADQVRAMHYGEADKEHIHGEASPKETEELLEEGVELMPLPFPVQPPEKQN